MKVVLFCGGLGTRLRDYSDVLPKPMVKIGGRPILWHLMKYYSYFGYNDFILALGYKSEFIKDYFLNYRETDSNDFILSEGGKKIKLLDSDIDEWKITFVDTGLESNIGMRLLSVKKFLTDEEIFLANYADGLTDMDLNHMIHQFSRKNNAVASFMSTNFNSSFHAIQTSENEYVENITGLNDSNIWANSGFFIFKKTIFDYIKYGEEIVEEPFQRLIKNKKLITYKYKGYWQVMDTFKDKIILDNQIKTGKAPWEVWRKK